MKIPLNAESCRLGRSLDFDKSQTCVTEGELAAVDEVPIRHKGSQKINNAI
jgi:hypothetical protein